MDLAALATNDNHSVSLVAAFLVAVTLPAAVILWTTYRHLAGTTLVIPWAWACGCGALVAASCAYGATLPAGVRDSAFAPWHFIATAGTLCPFVALVGAKRPQHAAWSFVVLSLWGVLSLPAWEVLLLQPGQQLEINAFRSWFLCAIMAAEIINFLLTRFGWAILLLVAAQGVWLLDYLPFAPRNLLPEALDQQRDLFGFVLLVGSLVAAWLTTLRRQPVVGPYDRIWLDFRDAFGLFWALRLSERVNAVATQENWGFDLGWSGFRTCDTLQPLEDLPAAIERPLQHNLQGLLRRFVTSEWIAERLQRSHLNEYPSAEIDDGTPQTAKRDTP